MNRFFFILFLLFSSTHLFAQENGARIDRVVAVVGDQIVKESEVENVLQQYAREGITINDSVRASVMEQLLFQKLLVAQAVHDSITVAESEIQQEMDRRMRFYLQSFGSVEAFEKFYGKTIDAFKFELHDKVRDLLLAQRMQAQITQNVTVSPSDVKQYFTSQPEDSLPFISSTVEVGQIVLSPPVNPEILEYTKMETENIRQRVIKGELDFCTAAALYSQDPGSAQKCGTYENIRRGTFVPEFEALMFTLKEGEISPIFKTDFGFHFLEVISRKGEEVTVRHILRTVPTTPEDLRNCKVRLDSIMRAVRLDSLTFCEAAAMFSTDDESKYSCGLIINPITGNSRIDVELLGQLDPDPNFPITVNQMKVGTYSAPMLTLTRQSKEGYRVLWIKSRSEPHRANLKDDYQMIQDMTLQTKQEEVLNKWVDKKLSTTYIRIAPDYRNNNFRFSWLKHAQ
ncbi:MAG: peptidylprolyl isomerase [Bacteroidia bacterium]|jgi:peptidyl-prolyl cis-trans isomerase SurA|nr:peptidylprolyl isomerase [Bacteroidia bacterium]